MTELFLKQFSDGWQTLFFLYRINHVNSSTFLLHEGLKLLLLRNKQTVVSSAICHSIHILIVVVLWSRNWCQLDYWCAVNQLEHWMSQMFRTIRSWFYFFFFHYFFFIALIGTIWQVVFNAIQPDKSMACKNNGIDWINRWFLIHNNICTVYTPLRNGTLSDW